MFKKLAYYFFGIFLASFNLSMLGAAPKFLRLMIVFVSFSISCMVIYDNLNKKDSIMFYLIGFISTCLSGSLFKYNSNIWLIMSLFFLIISVFMMFFEYKNKK